MILTTGTQRDREAARYTVGIGWEILSGRGSSNGAYGVNDAGDADMRLNLAPHVRLEGVGTFLIEDLVVADVGHWSVVNSLGIAVDNSRQLAVWAINATIGQSERSRSRP